MPLENKLLKLAKKKQVAYILISVLEGESVDFISFANCNAIVAAMSRPLFNGTSIHNPDLLIFYRGFKEWSEQDRFSSCTE